jgi:hypothetical protein
MIGSDILDQVLSGTAYWADRRAADAWATGPRFVSDNAAVGITGRSVRGVSCVPSHRPHDNDSWQREAANSICGCSGSWAGHPGGLGARWRGDDYDPYGEINLELHIPGGGIIWPIRRCTKRLANGPDDEVAA